MTSYWLPRQHARSAKRPFKLQLLKIIGKTKSVTYRFYFFVGNLPKFFNLLESMTKIYLVESELVEGNGYESRQTSKWYVIVMILAWSRDIKPAHAFKTRLSFKRHESDGRRK